MNFLNFFYACFRGHRNVVQNLVESLENEYSLVNYTKLPYDVSLFVLLRYNAVLIKFIFLQLNSLTWDKYHKINEEEIYCYCGRSGDWYMQMLQCARCQQWFHENCVQNLHYPLYCGDR